MSTSKGEQTRARVLDVAIRQLATHGYAATTMRGIAEEAGVSVGLAYRYFDGKPALVGAMYERLAQTFAATVDLPPGGWVPRSLAALDASLAVLRPHRAALAVLLASSTDDAALSPPLASSAPIVRGVFVEAVQGASDAPENAEELGDLLYLAQLGLLLFWVLDRSPEQAASAAMRAWGAALLPSLTLAWFIPGVGSALQQLGTIVRRGLGAPPHP